MKKVLLTASLATLFSMPVMADTVAGLYVGGQGWKTDTSGSFADTSSMANFNFDDETNTAMYVAIEHPLPFIPNVKINHTTLDSEGVTALQNDFTYAGTTFASNTTVATQSDITATDLILYYELFDNDLVSFDVGLNGKYVDGKLAVLDEANALQGSRDFSGIVPMVYSRVQVGLPFTGLAAYAEGSYLSIDDHKVSDFQVAVTYAVIDSLAVDMTVQLGYRRVDVDIDDLDDVYADLEYDGAFAGLEIHF
ncbi:TIGR04219 family outer membrane beta-barrel protein [Alteromonas sp. ASW11-130]|uniref:TIGR04219 family outer membrane beta-barrel protein n=1 Tax=Alteromonas sp. ASW11-130 TaxID=3015775 RepID=UPI002241D493|nr:TIGR04219 family outer membrane beta-barrel protein [Alteromonas sp. ASW11-130]MCW8092693.1 TIGR04219 family outer membrane beta-barrel protein [Alteromonas sp. ASW11-130]